MDGREIVSVTGRADGFDLVFANVSGSNVWTCTVPPDTTDGVYACEITALNSFGETGIWTGELYMVNGVCHLRIEPPKYWFRFRKPDMKISIRKRCRHGI